MKIQLLIASMLFMHLCKAQELYVFTEPASNMAAKSVGLRLNNYIAKDKTNGRTDYFLTPEIMVGVSKKIMVHGDLFTGNQDGNFSIHGASIYGKFRLYTEDGIQSHFRIATFARVSENNSSLHHEDINLYGVNSGFEGGAVATKLMKKVALSTSLSYLHAYDNSGFKLPYSINKGQALNYTFSVGKLFLPTEYKNFNQTNLNLMVEFLSQVNISTGKYYVDIAPAAQLIFNSRSVVDIGYRSELQSSFNRLNPTGIFVRFEYNFFNVY